MRQIIRYLCLVALLVGAAALIDIRVSAQELVPPTGPAIRLEVAKGTLLRLDRDADTVFVANPEIADVMVKTPRLIYIYGKGTGETSLYAVDKEQRVIVSKPVVVSRDIQRIQSAINQLVPDGAVEVRAVDSSLVLSGRVDSPGEAEEARRLARPFVADDKQLINHISVEAPDQINLRVRIVEVQHNVVKELGINWNAFFYAGSFAFGLATGTPVLNHLSTSGLVDSVLVPGNLTPAAPPLGAFAVRPTVNGGTADSGFAGFNNNRINLNSVIDALDQNGLLNILAEPNLTAKSGETASFLAGGEFPILVPQSNTGTAVTVEFKPFGVALAFTPVVLANGRISMRVRPEVSQISTTGQVQLQGFTIPALSTRRAETTVELGSGQTFAIGGLLQNNITDTINKVPGLNELPVLGPLFRSTSFQRNESELVIMVTPYLVRPSSQKMATPRDGYVPPNDLDIAVRGRDERPSAPEGGVQPVGPKGNSVIGPAGFILQ